MARTDKLRSRGFTLIEALGSLAMAALLLTGLTSVLMNALNQNDAMRVQNKLADETRFAMQRIVRSVQTTDRLFVPQVEVDATAYSEAVREPGVIALTMSPLLDRDANGIADADNDGDGLVNEDPTGDLSGDLAPGIIGIDDDNDGSIDEVHIGGGPAEDDDDEDGTANEDGWDGVDDDGDGLLDEDTKKDTSHDGEAGIIGVDDDGDGSIDEGDKNDDDEDGSVNEDWLDTVAYFLVGTALVERFPDLNGTSGNDYTERVIASNVSRFRVERLPRGTNRHDMLDILLELKIGESIYALEQRVRLASAP